VSTTDSTTALPASFAQELLWIADRAAPGNVAYNVPRARRLRGALNAAALQRAFDALVARHEILRTTYAAHEDQVVQVIHASQPVPFDYVDLSELEASAREAEVLRITRERGARPFDLATDLLMRVALLRVDAEEHVLLFESHHIAFDGWSRDVLFRELGAFYSAFAEGREPVLPPLPIQYADFSIWQREQLEGDRLDALLGWWRHELGDAEHVLRLPTDFPRPAESNYEGISRSIHFAPELRDGIRRLGLRYDATTYMVLLAAYATVLQRYTGQADVLIGSPIAGRAQQETEGLIGYFANTIVQRARFAGDPSFCDMLARLRDSALGAYDHQDVPFEKLVLELEGRTAVGVAPLFQVVFTQLDSSQAPDARMGDVTLEPFALDNATTKFELTLFMSERPDRLALTLRGRADLHRPDTIERMLGHIVRVLETATSNPDVHVSAIDLLTAEEHEWLDQQNRTAVVEGAPASIVDLFEEQAARAASRDAVVAPGAATADSLQSLTYAEINARANQLAHQLRAVGVVRGDRVALGLDRSVEALVGLLAILKAGAAYVPVPPDLPVARRDQLLRESGAKAVVSLAAFHWEPAAGVKLVALDRDDAAIAAHSRENMQHSALPDDAAYVLYTSGSTGAPKGVVVTHANVVHYTRAISRVLADVPSHVPGDGRATMDGWHFGMVSTLSADLGNTSLYPSLLSGGTLHILGKDVATEPERYARYVASHPLDVLKITPNHLAALTASRGGTELAGILPRKWLVLGGEALRLDIARALLRDAPARILNHYGPTETTVGVLTFEVTADSVGEAQATGARTVPIGRPLGNTSAFVMDANGLEQPTGIPGELYVSGDGVAKGYLGRPEQDAERFVRVRDARAYRTGDLVRRHPNGAIEFLGRADDQVKIRGYRVELGEVASAVRTHPAISEAVVLLDEDESGNPKLLAYAVAAVSGYAASHVERPTAAAITDWVAGKLPEYMVPAAILIVPGIPLTANGKIDRAALPRPVWSKEEVSSFVAPRTDTETRLAQIWCEVLKRDQVGVHDNFLELGGHSLFAIRMLGKITKSFGVRLPLRTLFESPTVAALGELIDIEMKLAALESMSDEDAAALLASIDGGNAGAGSQPT
jgi:amino acid adenylation domain-containing protein